MVSDTREAEVRQLRAKLDALKTEVYGTYVGAVQEDRPFYNLTFADRDPSVMPDEWREKGLKATVPPTAYNAVENANDHILKTPRVHVPVRPARSRSQEEQEIAERKRSFLRYFWENVELDGHPANDAGKNLISDGKGVFKILLDWDLVPDDMDEDTFLGLDGFLWRVTAPPPETIFEDPARPHDPAYVYECFDIRVGEAKSRYPDAIGQWKTSGDEKYVKLIEYWSKPAGSSKGRFLVWVEDEVVVDEDNPYHWETARSTEQNPDFAGFVPYVIRPSGWGRRTPRGEPDQLYVGILRRMHSVLRSEARQMTSADVQMMQATFPLIKTWGLAEGQKVEVGLGKIIRLKDPQQQNVEVVKWPEVPVSLFQLLQRNNDYANDLSKFGTLGGTPLRGVDTATEADNVRQNASAKLGGPVAALRSMYMDVNRKVLQCVERVIEAPVTVFGTPVHGEAAATLEPGDIQGFYMTSVELTTTDRAALDRQLARLWTDLYRMLPGLSEETAMENAGIEDPQRERGKRAAEDAFNGPMQRQLRELLSLVAMGDVAQEARDALIRQIQTAGQAQGGAPAAGGGGAPTPFGDEARPPAAGDETIQAAQQAAQVDQIALENQ